MRSVRPQGADDCTGAGGKDLILKVPVGTQLYEEDNNTLIYDLTKNKEFSWRAFSLPVDPEKKELMKLPSSIAVDKNGDLINKLSKEDIQNVETFFGLNNRNKKIFFSKDIDIDNIIDFTKKAEKFEIEKSINYKIIFDRIELGTYMIAAALIGKKILFDKIDPTFVAAANNEAVFAEIIFRYTSSNISISPLC